VILFFALYPQLALHRSERSVKASVSRSYRETSPHLSILGNYASTAEPGRIVTIK
jgi:hypothetical protein